MVLENLDIGSKKTSDFILFMKNIQIEGKKILILVNSFQENLILSSRNIRNVFVESVKNVSVYDLLDSDVILIDRNGIKTLELVLG